jgi:DNA-binding LytR/AlgR family response regulator
MSQTITALIAEDEAPQRQELRAMLAELWPELTVIAECEDGLDALEAWASRAPDIAFLDIRMPGLSGLEVARQAVELGAAQIVFITAYDEFAVKAFEAGAVDYLLKPIRPDRLAETVARLRARQTAPKIDMTALAELLSGQLAPRRAISWITASVGEVVKMISIDDVLVFQSEDKYTRVSTATESAHIRMPLKDLSALLDPDVFWRVHRNAIVRVAAIRQVRPDDDGRLQVWLKGVAEPVRVSDAFRGRFKAM